MRSIITDVSRSACVGMRVVSRAETAELIEVGLPFGMWTRVGRGNHLGAHIPPAENAVLGCVSRPAGISDVSRRYSFVSVCYDTIRYDTRCYFNVRWKADISQLNLSVCDHIFSTTCLCDLHHYFFVHVTDGRGSVLL